jgi:hypothetical protein
MGVHIFQIHSLYFSYRIYFDINLLHIKIHHYRNINNIGIYSLVYITML